MHTPVKNVVSAEWTKGGECLNWVVFYLHVWFVVRWWGGRTGPLILRHSHNVFACHLTAITSLAPIICFHHYQSRIFLHEWIFHTCWLHIWSAVLNLMGFVWIPRGCVTNHGWPVNWPPISFNSNHSHIHAALKYDSCNCGIVLGTYRFLHCCCCLHFSCLSSGYCWCSQVQTELHACFIGYTLLSLSL